jgi:hypothetical protein
MNQTKRISIGLLLVCLVIVMLPMMSRPDRAESGPLESADLDVNTGFKEVATQSLTCSSASAVIIGAIPAGCHSVEVIVGTAGDLNYGPSTVGTGTNWPYIAAGATKTFTKINTTAPTIYFCPRGTVATTTTVGIVAK